MNLAPFAVFKGKTFNKVTDAIALAAHVQHHSVNVLQPSAGMSGNIDVENDRLNVYLDADFKVYKFTVG